MIATRRKIDHSDSNSFDIFDSTLYVCTQLLLYLGCWQQPCKCRICQGIHLSFARPASTLTSPVTYCDVCIYDTVRCHNSIFSQAVKACKHICETQFCFTASWRYLHSFLIFSHLFIWKLLGHWVAEISGRSRPDLNLKEIWQTMCRQFRSFWLFECSLHGPMSATCKCKAGMFRNALWTVDRTGIWCPTSNSMATLYSAHEKRYVCGGKSNGNAWNSFEVSGLLRLTLQRVFSVCVPWFFAVHVCTKVCAPAVWLRRLKCLEVLSHCTLMDADMLIQETMRHSDAMPFDHLRFMCLAKDNKLTVSYNILQ